MEQNIMDFNVKPYPYIHKNLLKNVSNEIHVLSLENLLPFSYKSW